MKLSIVNLLRAFALSCLALLIALSATGAASAQESSVKPIRLVTGVVIPDVVRPAEVKVAPDAIFDGKYFKLIQFAQIPGDSERRSLPGAGLHLVDYLPDNTYFAVINRGFDLNRLAGQAVTIIEVADVFRLEPRLAAMRAERRPVDKLVVSYYATLDATSVMADLKAHGVAIEAHRDYSRQLDIALDPARLEEIIALPYLQFLGPEPEEPVLEPYDHQNASGRSNYLNTGYNGLNYNGAGEVVGIGEGGTVDNLVDAKGRLTELVSGSPSGHKIGVMQNAGGAGNLDPTDRNNAWGATLLSLIGSPDYAGLYASHNLRYTNHSYGVDISGGYDSTARDHDLRIATYPNHLVIYSSGNSGESQGYAPYNFAGCPADPTQCWANITGQRKQNKNMFAIGALSPADVLTGFSSRGPMYDGRIIPQLVIEGAGGTSYAAPKIAGVLAQLAQVYKTKNGGAEPPSSLLRAIMMNTADDVGNAGPDHKHGYGRPNLRRAYNMIDNARFLTSSVSNGGTNSHTITVPANTKQVRVMIVWPDVAAAVSANPAIVNDLNLLVKDPSATTSYNPWVLDYTANPTNLDLPATRQVDNRNTIEQVTVDDPAAGDWTAQVSGANVPSGPQTYYLTYEFLGDELTMMFPLKDHRFVSGTAYQLKWDSYGASGTFTLDYQLDGGSWTNIATGYDATSRNYQWTAPSVSGIHTIKFRVQRGSLTSTSDVNYIGPAPRNPAVQWACADAVKLSWDAVSGATGYKVYRLGAQYMAEVTSGITFDGMTAILTGQSTTSDEYYAVSAVTGAYEGQRTSAIHKSVGDVNCFNIKTTTAASVDKTDITLMGLLNPHGSTLTGVHFEYGPTTAYGSTSADIPVTVSGQTEQAVSAVIPSTLTSRTDVTHFRLVGTKDGSPVYGDDQLTQLAPGSGVTFDGVGNYVDVSSHNALPIARRGTGTAYSVAMWVKATPAANGLRLYSETSSTGSGKFALQTYTNGYIWVNMADDAGTSACNSLVGATALDGTWHHIAWVDSNGAGVLYVDGNSGNTLTCTSGSLTLDRASIGAALGSSASNFFAGSIDEVSLWDKALSVSEVRSLMHQPLQGNEANLKAYYQFDGVTNRAFDVATGQEATLAGGATASATTEPVGVGSQYTATEADGAVTLTGTGMTVYYNSQAGGTVSGSWINLSPNTVSGVSGSAIFDSQYWVIHRYGTGSFNANVTFTVSEALTAQDEAQPFRIKLYSRAQGSDGAWSLVTYASNVNATAKQATFYGVTAFNKQYIIARLDDAKSWDGSESTDWFNADNWTPSGVPTAADDVLVASTAPNQPAINAAGAVCRNISIGSGASLTMSGATAYTLSVAGDWINSGTFNRGIGTVDFNGTNSYQDIGGTSTTNFNILSVTKGAKDRILEATALITLNAAADPLVLTSGTFKLSSASTITPFTTGAGAGLTSSSGLWNNGGAINYGNFSWYLNAGLLRISAGTVNVGTNSDNSITYMNNGALIMEGGALNIAGRFKPNSGSSSGAFTQSGGVITVNTVGSTDTSRAPFELNSGVPFTMNGGTLAIRRSSSHSTADIIILSTTSTVTGGALQIGDASTPAGQTIRINSVAPIYNLVVNAANAPTAQLVANGLTVKNDVTISGGTLNVNNLSLTAEGAITNNGALMQTKTVSGASASFLNIKNQAGTVDKYWGATIDPGSSDMGNTTVKISGNQLCPGALKGVKRCFDLTPTTPQTAAVTFYYTEAERNGASNANMSVYHWNGSTWDLQTGTTTRGGSGDSQWTRVTGIAAYSPFALNTNSPLAVTLEAFSAQATSGGVTLTWETVSEVDNAGFDIYRARSEPGPWTRLNPVMIPSLGPGASGGYSYTWMDTTAQPGATYFYRLEGVGLRGDTAILGVARVDLFLARQIWLPVVGR